MAMRIQLIDEHVQAFLVWQQLAARGHSGILFHVDSHDDMGHPSVLDQSLYSVKDFRSFSENNLTIASFIVPAVILGIFSRIYDLRSANQPTPTASGSTKDKDGKIRFRRAKRIFKHSYFSWKDEGVFWYRDLGRKGMSLAHAKRRHQCIYKPIFSLSHVPRGLKVVLDIDMDYFSCNHFVDYQFRPRLTPRQIREAVSFSTSNDSYKMDLGLVAVDRDGRFVEAGAYGLNKRCARVYNDDPLWIDFAIREFVAGFRRRLETDFVSIARSVKTGYTPAKHASLIENKLMEYLKAKTPIDPSPPGHAVFAVQADIAYDSERRRIINKRNLDTFDLENDADQMMWEMIQEGARFSEILEKLMKDHLFSRVKAQRELLGNVWYLKKSMVIK